MNKQKAVVQEMLPFTVELAADTQALRAAVQIRQMAYARHLPDVAKTMVDAESWDFREGAVVLVAKSKLDGTPIGTMRIHTNEFAPLPLEQSYELPEKLTRLRLAEATRLGVEADSTGPVVKTALFKAYYLYCMANNIDFMVITARRPLDRMYERLLFDDVVAGAGYIPMAHVGGIAHRVMQFDVKGAEALWRANKHPLYSFVCDIMHPDILVTPTASSPAVAPVSEPA